ncbi:hypothetical protein Aperf_G00000005719 [Anoplocephala perfoliata]
MILQWGRILRERENEDCFWHLTHSSIPPSLPLNPSPPLPFNSSSPHSLFLSLTHSFALAPTRKLALSRPLSPSPSLLTLYLYLPLSCRGIRSLEVLIDASSPMYRLGALHLVLLLLLLLLQLPSVAWEVSERASPLLHPTPTTNLLLFTGGSPTPLSLTPPLYCLTYPPSLTPSLPLPLVLLFPYSPASCVLRPASCVHLAASLPRCLVHHEFKTSEVRRSAAAAAAAAAAAYAGNSPCLHACTLMSTFRPSTVLTSPSLSPPPSHSLHSSLPPFLPPSLPPSLPLVLAPSSALFCKAFLVVRPEKRGATRGGYKGAV